VLGYQADLAKQSVTERGGTTKEKWQGSGPCHSDLAPGRSRVGYLSTLTSWELCKNRYARALPRQAALWSNGTMWARPNPEKFYNGADTWKEPAAYLRLSVLV